MRATLAVTFAVLLASAASAQAPERYAGQELAPPRAEASLRPGGNGFYLEPIPVQEGKLFLVTGVVVAPDGTKYLTQKQGNVRVVRTNGELPVTPVLSLYGEAYEDGDRGLTGIALHPDFPATRYLYLLYPVDDIQQPPRPDSRLRGYSRLTRYTIDETGESVVPGSRRVLLGETPETGIPSCYNSHSAGSLRFGHDGMLYLSHGDGASWNTPDGGGLYDECFDGTGISPTQDLGAFRAQTANSMSGGILRVDPETGLGLPDNPFWTGDGADAASRVWALGMRNPFRFAVAPFDPDNPTRTELFVGDVGDGLYEEINRVSGGENFGWPCIEGPQPHPVYPSIAAPPGLGCDGLNDGVLTAPYAYFHHTDPTKSAPAGRTAASITGGTFYTGDAYPERYRDMLFFADFSAGWISAARVGEDGLEGFEEIIAEAGPIVDLAYDPAADEIVGVDLLGNGGQLVRLRHSGDGQAPPVARATVSARYGEIPHEVTFSSAGSFDPAGSALTYSWAFGDGTTAEGPEATHVYTEAGLYSATLTLTTPDGVTATALANVSVGESLPELTIVEPSVFVIPETGVVPLELTASDRRGEQLTTFWEVDLVHNVHTHPAYARVDGATGSVITESHAGPGEVAFYVARAVVVDEEGLRITETRTLRSPEPDEIEVGVAPAAGAVNTYVFSEPVDFTRLTVQGAVGPDVRVEVLDGGDWVAARSPHILPEGDVTQILVARVVTEGVRLVGAPGALSVGVQAFLDADADLPDGWDAADAGGATAGRTIAVGEDGLTLAGSGDFAAGSFHTARRILSGNSILVGRLTGLDGEAGAAAGLAAHTGLGAQDGGVSIGVTPAGTVRAWATRAGEIETTDVAEIAGPVWFRIRRESGRVIAEASADSLTWVSGASVAVGPETPLIAGPAVAGGARAAIARFEGFELLANVVAPPPSGELRVFDLYPNPGRGQATFVVEAGIAGTYTAQVVDVRGRVLLDLAPRVVAEPETLRMTFSRAGFSQGVYYVRVRNDDTGDARLLQFVTLR